MNRRRLLLALAGLALMLAASSACSDDDDDGGGDPDEPVKAVFMAGFRPQANLPFVAAYAADEQGFFAEEGLEVEIRHSGGGDEHIQLLLGGTVDVTTHLASGVLQQRTNDPALPLVSFVLWGQRSPAGFVTLAESGIDSIEDFPGHTYGFKGAITPEYLATLDAAGVDRDDIEEVSVGFDPSVLVDGQVDILAVFLNNEPDTLRNVFDKEVNVFDPADFGVAALGLTYVATEETVNERGDLLERFTRASLRGARWAIDNEEAAISIVLERMDADDDQRPHQTFLFREDVRQAQSGVTEERGLGWMTAEQWEANAQMLLDYGVVSEMPDVESAFTTEFLEEAD